MKQVGRLISFFLQKASTSRLHKTVSEHDNKYTPLNLSETTNNITQLQDEQTNVNTAKIDQWKAKALHGRHPHDLEHADIDREASNKWLIDGSLFVETEGFIIAVQDQATIRKTIENTLLKTQHLMMINVVNVTGSLKLYSTSLELAQPLHKLIILIDITR